MFLNRFYIKGKNKMNTELLQKYISGDANIDETELVVKWINASNENRREYMAQRKLYDIALWRTSDLEQDELLGNRKRPAKIMFREILKIAALLAIAFSLSYLWFNGKDSASGELLQSVYTPAGQRTEIHLPDGTHVWLNSCSRLTYSNKFIGKYRRVKLEGEAYFIVSKNKEKPFIVQTNRYNIKVLGTEFNITAYPADKEWKTSLLNGCVKITDRSGVEKMMLKPNDVGYLDGARLRKTVVNDDNEFMWRKGLLCFTDLSIHEMVHKLELYYDVKIIIHNSRMMNKYYTGKFRIGDGIEHVLSVLKLDNKFSYTYNEDNKLIIIN